MNKPEAGSTVAIIVLDAKGQEHTFRLALVRDDTFKAFNGTPRYDYMYIDDEGSMISSTYSGGITGSGIDWNSVYVPNSTRSTYYERYQVVSTDLNEINAIVGEINCMEEEKRQARELERQLKEAAVAAQVELDKPITTYKDDQIEVCVTPRFYKTASGLRRFEVQSMYTRNAAWGERERLFRVENFLTPSGKISTKATKLFGAAGPAIILKTKAEQDRLFNIYKNA
jgi:hypothetical protein